MQKYLYVDPCYIKDEGLKKLKFISEKPGSDGDWTLSRTKNNGDIVYEELGVDSGRIAKYEVLDESVESDIAAGFSGYLLSAYVDWRVYPPRDTF